MSPNLQKSIQKAKRALPLVTRKGTEHYLKRLGYPVIYANTSEGNIFLQKHHLEQEAKRRKSFTFSGSDPCVFIKKSTHPLTTQFLLLHELGHILLGHTDKSTKTDPQEGEKAANEFAEALMVRARRTQNIKHYLQNHWDTPLRFAGIAVILILIIPVILNHLPDNSKNKEPAPIAVTAQPTPTKKPKPTYTPKPQSAPKSLPPVSEEEAGEIVYITPYGECFHKADCGHLGKNRIRTDYNSAAEDYRPCQYCMY